MFSIFFSDYHTVSLSLGSQIVYPVALFSCQLKEKDSHTEMCEKVKHLVRRMQEIPIMKFFTCD